MKKKSAVMLAFIMLFTAFLNPVGQVNAENVSRALSAAAPGAPTGLKAELLEEAFGLNTKNPAFSWVMNDVDENERQTAYRIVVGTTLNNMSAKIYVKDTGWVKSDESSYVKTTGWVKSDESSHVKAAADDYLEDNRLYYWQVQVKDKDGLESPLSEPKAMTTGVGEEWESINGIWVGSSTQDPYLQAGWTNYSVEMTMKTSTAIGIMFRARDDSSCYMWQIRASDNKLTPHKKSGGSWAAMTAVDLSAKGVTLPTAQYFSVKITAVGNTFNTYIDTTGTGNSYVLVDTRTDSDYTYGPIGFRTGSTESGTVDNIKVSALNSNGTVQGTLYETDFTDGVSYFSGCSTSGTALTVPTGLGTGARLSMYLSEKGNFMFARNEFELPAEKNVEKAIVSVTAKSPEAARQYVYNLYMNGEFVGLGPARFGKDILYYNTFDVTDLLNSGTNVIGAINYTTTEKQFLLQMTLYYEDGTREILLNTGSDYMDWKVLDGTNAFGDNGTSIGTGYFTAAAENINAAVFPYGWDQVGYDDSAWSVPVRGGNIVGSYTLEPYTADNVKRHLVDSVNVVDKGNRNYFIDLGKEIVGGVYLDIDSPSAGKITVAVGEELSADNTVKYNMRTGNNFIEYWTLKTGSQVIQNIGMKTFRYIEISNCPVALTQENVKGIAMYQDFDDNASSFTSSDNDLNRIYEFCKYSIKATNQDLYVDSQSRERRAYEGDVIINMLSSYSYEADYSLARFSIEYLNDDPTWPAEYRLFSVITSWLDYEYTGNKDSLVKYYDTLKDKLYFSQLTAFGTDYLLKRVTSANNTWDAILVDWPESERDSYSFSSAEYNTVFNAVAYGAYRDMAKIAEVVGNVEDAQAYAEYAEKIKTGMIAQLYDEEKGAFLDGLDSSKNKLNHYAQHATAFALAYGIYEDQEMAEKMADYISTNGLKTSVYGSFFVLEGLYNAGDGSAAMDIMTGNGTRSWLHVMDDLGATMATEAWDPANKTNMTYSHPWGSAPGSQITRGIFGIMPIEAGFKKFQIKFQPGDLTKASITTPTVKGTVGADFDLTGKNGFMGSVTIPCNTTAEVSVPVTSKDSNYIAVNGKVMKADRVNGYLTLELGSGTYQLAMASGYHVNVIKSENGTVSVNKTSAREGETVAVTISANQGYELDKLIVTDKEGRNITVTGGSFTMPESDVTVTAAFKKSKVNVTGVTVNKSKVTLTVGRKFNIIADVTPSNATVKGVTFKSDNTKVAKVTQQGLVTAKSKGKAKITVAAKDDASKKTTVTITVNKLNKTVVKVKKSKKTIQLTWNKVSGASGYVIERSLKKTKGYSTIKTIKSGNTLKYNDKKKLKKNKTYYYRIRAYVTVDGKKIYSDYSKVRGVEFY